MKTIIIALLASLELSGCTKQPTEDDCQLYGMEARLDAIGLSMGHSAAEQMKEIDARKTSGVDKARSKRVLALVVDKMASGDQVYMACVRGEL